MKCTLCSGLSVRPFRTELKPHAYYHCETCDLRFLDPAFHLSYEDEKKRYQSHNNDPLDAGYQKFLSPVFDALVSRFDKAARLLDFGAGPGPALYQSLLSAGFSHAAVYDPYFFPDESTLTCEYDAVSATEVIEHFRDPADDFKKIRKCLRPGGSLVLMTHFFDATTIDFNSWYYRKDPTHVSFYSRKTMEWIREYFGFTRLEFITERVVVLD